MNNIVFNTALILTIIGGLNWGLIGLFGFDLVAFLYCLYIGWRFCHIADFFFLACGGENGRKK